MRGRPISGREGDRPDTRAKETAGRCAWVNARAEPRRLRRYWRRRLQRDLGRHSASRLPQPRGDALGCDLQYSLHVSKLRFRQIVEIHESMLELATARRVFDGKPNFLQRDSSMIVLSKHVDARLLQGAEETPSTPGAVVIALPIVLAIPNRLISQNLVHSCENAEVLARDRTTTPLKPQPAKPSARRGDEQQTRQGHHTHEHFLQGLRVPLMPQPPNPKTGQGHPGQSDPENRAVTHTKPRRFSVNSRRIDRCPPNYYWSIRLTPFRNHPCGRGASVGRDLADAAQQGPPTTQAGRQHRRPRWPCKDGIASTRARASCESFRLAPVRRTASGTPCPSQIRCRLLPLLARSVGFGPVCVPPHSAHGTTVPDGP